MKVIQTLLARVVLFADIRRINPNGLALRPIHVGLLKRYKFLKYPTKPDDFDFAKGVRYSDGEFMHNGKLIAVSLNIFNDGWVVESLDSTEGSEAFWQDAAKWVETIGFLGSKMFVSRTTYESQLVVQTQSDMARQFAKLQTFATLIRSLREDQKDQSLTGFYIGAEGEQISTFTFERLIGVPFKDNKYFSRASLQTKDHIRALEELEKVLK